MKICCFVDHMRSECVARSIIKAFGANVSTVSIVLLDARCFMFVASALFGAFAPRNGRFLHRDSRHVLSSIAEQRHAFDKKKWRHREFIPGLI